jgi:hypothetical protein
MPPITIGASDDDTAIRALAACTAGRVRVVAAHAFVGRVAVHHRVHVAGRDAEEQARRAKPLEVSSGSPVGLRDDADAKTLCLEHAAHYTHAKARMIDVGVARHENHVALIPAERIHLVARHRQERCRRQTMRPELSVAE